MLGELEEVLAGGTCSARGLSAGSSGSAGPPWSVGGRRRGGWRGRARRRGRRRAARSRRSGRPRLRRAPTFLAVLALAVLLRLLLLRRLAGVLLRRPRHRVDRRRSAAEHERGDQREDRPAPHRTSTGRANVDGVRDDPGGVDAEPLLQQRAVDGAEVGGVRRLSSSSSVARPGNSPTMLPVACVPISEREAGGAVVGAAAVLLRPAAELAPHVDQHAVGEAARLEVALERQRLGPTRLDRPSARSSVVVVGVVAAVGVERDAPSAAAPSSSIAASAASRRAKPSVLG